MTTSGKMLQEGLGEAVRLRILTIAGAVVILLVTGVIGILKVGADGYYVLSPGQAPLVTASPECRPVGGGAFALAGGEPCVQLIVPPAKAHPISGSIMLVDVYEGKPNPWQFLLYKLGLLKSLGGDAVLLPNADIIGNGTPAQLSCQNSQQAAQATSAAPVAALRQLGYSVKEEDLGAQIDEVVPGTPAAASGLRCNDLVTAVNGHPVHSATDLTSALHNDPPGTVVSVTVSRSSPSTATKPKSLTLSARLASTPAINGQPAHPNQGFLGLVSETRTTYDFPFPVSAQVGSIGGPSDGLALALGLIDTLSQGRLTGGLRVAATGEIDPAGNVIEIGGAAQKAVAVRRAGAQVFFVPKANFADAKSEAGRVKVYAVSTLAQALSDLRALGGQLPQTNASGATGLAAG